MGRVRRPALTVAAQSRLLDMGAVAGRILAKTRRSFIAKACAASTADISGSRKSSATHLASLSRRDRGWSSPRPRRIAKQSAFLPRTAFPRGPTPRRGSRPGSAPAPIAARRRARSPERAASSISKSASVVASRPMDKFHHGRGRRSMPNVGFAPSLAIDIERRTRQQHARAKLGIRHTV